MVLLSFVFRKLPGTVITNALHLKLIKFVEKMQVHPEIFKGYYKSSEIDPTLKDEIAKAKKMNELMKQWVKSFHLASLDVFQSSLEDAITTAKKVS